MKLFNWQKIAFLSILLAFSANIFAAENLSDVMERQGLTEKDVLAVAETYVPTGKRDEYIVFSSGGESGQIIVAQVATAEKAPEAETTDPKADYEKLENANLAQLASIHKEMGVILSQNYYDFPEIASSVTETLKQLNIAKKAENNAKAAAEKGDWQAAITASKQWQQSQDKAADMGAQIKTALKQQPGTKEVVTAHMINKLAPKPAEGIDGTSLYKDKGCGSCHGADGNTPLMVNYPKLAGQNQSYLLAQMKDLRSGVRENAQAAIMKGIMAGLNEAEIEAIAKWLSSLPINIKRDFPMDSEGAKLYKTKTCIACHGNDANTPIMPIYPKLAGQNQAYAIAQMTDIKSGARQNGQSLVMKGIMQGVTEEEIASIAEWLDSLKGKTAVE
jgi:cytochrome c553